MNGFLGTGNGHSEQRTTAGGNPPTSPGGTARSPDDGPAHGATSIDPDGALAR